MRAEISKINSIIVFSLNGQISYETLNHFRHHCFTKLNGEKVIFNLAGLNFVGSVGMTSFFEIIRDLHEQNIMSMNFCCVRIEFKRLLEAWFFDNIEIFDSQDEALKAFLNPKVEDPSKLKKPIRVPNHISDDGFTEQPTQGWNESVDLLD